MRKKVNTFKCCSLALAITAATAITTAQAADVKLSGFISVGGGYVDTPVSEGGYSYIGYSEKDITIENNIFGLQATGKVAEDVTATAQFVARGINNYQVNSEWAYVTYQVTDSSKIRAGRMRTPFYMYSDFLDVGYSYPWISPPREVYYLPFNNINGVDFYTTASLGSFDTSLQAYFGGFDDETDFSGISAASRTRNQMGLALTIGRDWWTFRTAYHQADLWLDISSAPMGTTTIGGFANTLTAFGFAKNGENLLVNDDKTTFAEVGLNIDTGTFVGAIEHVEFEAKNTLLAKNVREYVMGGVRFGDFLVDVTLSKSQDKQSHPETGIPAGVALPVVGSTNFLIGTLKAVAESQIVSRDVLTVGARWDFTAGTALKLQLDKVDDDALGKQQVLSFALQTVF